MAWLAAHPRLADIPDTRVTFVTDAQRALIRQVGREMIAAGLFARQAWGAYWCWRIRVHVTALRDRARSPRVRPPRGSWPSDRHFVEP